jgi:probable phosphoglycerate mutase
MTPTLYFVRHGETAWNADGRLQGQRDIPLNPLGRSQAAEAANRLRDLGAPYRELRYVASPLSRTRETMEILLRTLGLPVEDYALDARLKELTFGLWEGLTWKQVRRADPLAAAAREKDKWHMVPPDGESYAMLIERMRPVVDELDQDTVMVAHGGTARALMVALDVATPAMAADLTIEQGAVYVFSGGQLAKYS